MPTIPIPIAPSIASTSASIGRDAAKHLDRLWRDVMNSQGAVQDEHSFRLITGEQHPLGNVAILSESSGASLVEEVVAPLLELAAPTAVLFVSGVSDAVAQQLTAKGFSVINPMPAMAVDIASLRPTQLPQDYDFVRVSAGNDGTEWADVVAAGFQLPRGLARMLSPEVLEANLAHDAKIQFFGVRRDGRLVATSMLYLANGLAGIYCVATMPEERGRGLGAHVTAEALRAAHQIGYGVGVLQSSEAGHSVYLALGFQDFDSVQMFMRMPG